LTISAVDFVRANTSLTTVPLLPEMNLHLAPEMTPVWQALEDYWQIKNVAPPFWAFAWPGGQGLARYILDNPQEVSGKRVLDFAAGSGMAAIAAHKSGARRVMAADIDPLAQVAIQMNASRNGAAVGCLRQLDMEKAPADCDVILAGDVCYEQAMSSVALRWLRICACEGVKVLLSDPGRAYVPESGLKELARYVVPVNRDLEDRDTRDVTVWEMTGV
jgi:predicted nicotinamide N-methyase